MSKLYATIDSDARKSQATSRGHKWVKVAAMHNFTGGQEADGMLVTLAEHHGTFVQYDISYVDRVTGKFKRVATVKVADDGYVVIE